MKRRGFRRLCVIIICILVPSLLLFPTPVHSTAWSVVLNDQFNNGVIPAHYVLYSGPYADHTATNSCAAPSHDYVSGGALHLLMRYETLSSCGAHWYTGGLSIAPAYRHPVTDYMDGIDQRITLRFRIMADGVVSHRNIPMRSSESLPYDPEGEEDFCENDGFSSHGCWTWLHYDTRGESTIANWEVVDLPIWHIYQFTKLNHVVTVVIDGIQTWRYKGSATTLPDIWEKLVLQQECQLAGCPTTTAGTEDIQVDWVTIQNPA